MNQYFRDIFVSVWSVLIGMAVTFRHLFVPAVTIQYPDVKLKLPERARNRLYVNMDDCIGCLQCEIACPVNCITIDTVKSLPTEDLGITSTGHKKRLWVTQFDIDIAKCCYCGLCVYPCPTECIVMTDVYEFSEFKRHDLVYNYITLTKDEITSINNRSAEYEKEQAAKKAAAAQVKTTPAVSSTAGSQEMAKQSVTSNVESKTSTTSAQPPSEKTA